jgi:hypothetical protein
MLVRKRVVLVAGAASVLLVGGGTAGAAIASGPVASGVIHACYTTKASSSGGHAIALENAGTRCPRHTKALTWNQVGPKGATGPTGPVGAVGPQGPPGVATGYEASFRFNAGLLTNTTVLTLTLPTNHAFLVTATVELIGDGKDTGTVECDLNDPSATLNRYQATLVPDSGRNEQDPIALTGATRVGGKISLVCSVISNPPGATWETGSPVITAIPVTKLVTS